jgi:hypothetical protein
VIRLRRYWVKKESEKGHIRGGEGPGEREEEERGGGAGAGIGFDTRPSGPFYCTSAQ